jgi:glyoxylase-like metal-dependent hydrolase (beta-lactamase superfamily II)
VQGFPGKAVCHWRARLEHHRAAALRSAQHPDRCRRLSAFASRWRASSRRLGVAPDDITDVVLTHAHYDHSVNFVLFDRATVWIGAKEIEWAAAQPPGFDPLPELYVQALATDPRVKRIREGEEFLPGIVAFDAPGHTPGSLVFHLTANALPVIFTGDAAKNRAELISRKVDMSLDEAASTASIERIWQLWRAVPGTIVIPGHDLSMRLDEHGRPDLHRRAQGGHQHVVRRNHGGTPPSSTSAARRAEGSRRD